jgi:RsiW-degrading membrane proteinase PrsW (M82 family)
MNFCSAVLRYAFFRYSLGLLLLVYANAGILIVPEYVDSTWLFQSAFWPESRWTLVLMAVVGANLLAWACAVVRPYVHAPQYQR